MAISGQKTVPSAGTAVALGVQPVCAPLLVKALDTNTGVVAIGCGDAGGVTLANGLRLESGEAARFAYVGSLANIWLDAAVNGEGVCWLILAA